MRDASSWDRELASLAAGGDRARLERFLSRLPAGYRERTSPAEALADLAEVEALAETAASPAIGPAGSAEQPVMGLRHRLAVRPSDGERRTFRLRRFGYEGIELTAALPLLESFGLVVVEAVPTRLEAGDAGEPPVHIDDIGIRVDSPYGPEALRFVPAVHGRRLVEAIDASAAGRCDVDSLNRLVTAAGLDWHQVTVIRAYLRYWLQTGVGMTYDELADPLVEYPDVARGLIGYFQARFDPRSEPPAGSARGSQERALCEAQLDLVAHLEQDRALRGLLGLIDATVRTNDYSPSRGPALVIKLSGREVPGLAPPRPLFEAFVHGPAVEGVHIRAGLIARGGLRWSERPADFRTEILDLAFAQVKKNAIIVPTGAKGGFVCRTAASAHPGGQAHRQPGPEEVRYSYEQFVEALLDVTDNLVGGSAVSPPGVVAADGPDPYLVVAADKGTAALSDVANAISERRGFWLGDAFASGGSHGYDHKAMGITAKGAWVAVRRHFRELGIDVATEPIRVAGVGDMSGDVFGNGMLQSRAIKLVAAFDHRHVFIDPDPDPASSYEERARLARLEHSSWADYSTKVISDGGGVWPRDAKSIPLSPAAQAVLGVTAATLTPPEVISAILAAPVDLLWFGGIGTYVKAPGEADADVGDHDNDAVRVTSDRVRARVVAEGANLAVTQRARIRYSRRGGRINADFIDNAAGVATSDREVNLKILLTLAAEKGRLRSGERDRYLRDAEGDVAAEVLRQVDHSVAALNRAASGSDRLIDAYESLVDDLEAAGRFDRGVEVLPDAAEFAARRAAGAGLIRPELATLLAYAKSDLVAAIEAWPGLRDPALAEAVTDYFPPAFRRAFGDLVPEHRLYPQLAATDMAGELVDQMGVVWGHDLAAELGRGLAEVAVAFWVARRLTGAGRLWEELEALAASDGGLSAPAEAALHAEVADAVGMLARTLLLRPGQLDPALRYEGSLPDAGPPPQEWKGLGLDGELAERFLDARRRAAAVRDAPIAAATGHTVAEIGMARRLLDEASGAAALVEDVTVELGGSPPPGRARTWQARALLDDLEAWRTHVLTTILAGDEPAAAVSGWAERNSEAISRVAALRSTARSGTDRLAAVSLAVRRLCNAAP
ncbi:MAG TPA: NAD-glutamate dehydrogenase domain-containing protein [Acidimicrobiales bacterium]|nr:NAD-glutamate dehydrogenase domain-containing protein [Acidimicrobiales bacterium]